MKLRTLASVTTTAILLLTAPTASAGPYGDTLAKCLVKSTSSAEKTTLVQWMFATIALHPDVQALSSVTPQQRGELNKKTARLFERLIAESCVNETRDAIKYEGTSTIESSFSLLGQVATRELFTNPRVSEGLAELGKQFDEEKLKKALETPQ